MDKCPICSSDRIVFREKSNDFRCRKCNFIIPATKPPLSKREKERKLSSSTKSKIGDAMSRVWERRRKNKQKEKDYSERMSATMKKRYKKV